MAALTHYNFSTDFQSELLACMIRHPDLFMGLSGVIDYGYFTGNVSQRVCKLMQDFYEERHTYPNFAILETLIIQSTQKTGESELAEQLTAFVTQLSEIEIRAKEVYRDQAVNFAKERALIKSVTEVAEDIQAGRPHDGLVNKFQKALAVGQNLDDQGYIIKHDYQKIIDKVTNKEYGTATGYDLFDTKIWKRGWGPGWLIVPLAPPKRFKTAFCINLAMNMVGPKCAYDVLYYANEISAELAAIRTFQNLIGATQDEVHDDPDEFKRRVYEGFQINMPGNLYIKHFPAKTATIADIRADALTRIEAENLKPRAIFIDYAETVKPNSGNGKGDVKEYRQQSDIYTEARALGDELKCPIIMPDRCNRETVNQATPSMDSFQGSFEKGGIVDIGIGLCATDQEYDRGDLRFFVFLDRHGVGGIHIRGKIDKARMRISVDERLKDYEAAEVEAQIQEQKERKYSNRMRKGRSKETDPRLEEESAPVTKPRNRPPRV